MTTTGLRHELEKRIAQMQAIGHDAPLERFLLENGRDFQVARFEGQMMPAKRCFKNALQYAGRRGFRYAEGFAISGTLLSSGIVFPVHHAWCVDEDGNAVDPTWGDSEAGRYFGMDFDVREVLKRVTGKESYGMFVTGRLGIVDLDYLKSLDPEFFVFERRLAVPPV